MKSLEHIRVILASQSPRRRELMKQAGFSFEVIPARGEEQITSTHPAEVVEELSRQKAMEVAAMCDPKHGNAENMPSDQENVQADRGNMPSDRADETPADRADETPADQANEIPADRIQEKAKETLVVGADTVVAIDHRILGKPADHEDARQMIRELQGRVHQVFTGVTLILKREGEQPIIRTFHECTDVHVFPMEEEEIEAYISTDEPYDKAGAYGIQGAFGIFIGKIDGDYNNVVGLPIARLYHEVMKML